MWYDNDYLMVKRQEAFRRIFPARILSPSDKHYYTGCGKELQLKFCGFPHGGKRPAPGGVLPSYGHYKDSRMVKTVESSLVFTAERQVWRKMTVSVGRMPMKILVVDDEKLLVKGIKFNLENEGYSVDACYNGEDAVTMARGGGYDLIILDLMMPGKDGLQAAQEIRGFSAVPIIMLTARSERSDKLMGFESGADDYVTKPFDILELKARVRALLRRASLSAPAAGGGSAGVLQRGHIAVDEERRAAYRAGESVELTMKEFDLILFLMKNPGKVYSREVLLDLVWGYEYQGDTRTVDVHIRRLREKLELDPANPEYIITKWGVGYYFNEK